MSIEISKQLQKLRMREDITDAFRLRIAEALLDDLEVQRKMIEILKDSEKS